MPTVIRYTPLVLLVTGGFWAFGCTHVSTVKRLRIVGTTDVHGYFSAPSNKAKPGGLARLGAFLDFQRRSGRSVLLVDSGDMWSGTLLSDSTQGALGIAAYNTLGVDAAALGNHEFDYGPKTPNAPDPFVILKRRIAEARFPILAANLVDRRTGKLPEWPGLRSSVVVRRGGFKVGIIGAITPATPTITFPFVDKYLRFLPPGPAIRAEADRLLARGVDFNIVVTHIGGLCRDLRHSRDLSSCEPNGPSFKLARFLDATRVKAIFGGHTHRQTAHWVNGIAVVQAGKYGRSVAVVDVVQRDEAPPVLQIQRPMRLDDNTNSPTARRVRAILAPHEARVARIRGEHLGARVAVRLGTDRKQSSALGTYMCDVARKIFSQTQICFLNSGGLRRPLPAGPLTYGSLYDVMPFGNHAAVMSVSGKTLLEILRVGTSGAHGVFQVSGLRIRYDRGRDHCPKVDRDGNGKVDAHDRQRLVSVTLENGKPVDPQGTYKVVTSSFLASGGDGLKTLLKRIPAGRIQVLYGRLSLRDLIAAYMRRHRPLINSADKKVMPYRRVRATGTTPRSACP